MSSLAVVEATEYVPGLNEMSLEELARRANDAHQAHIGHIQNALTEAIKCGEYLLEAWNRITERGTLTGRYWTSWSRENLLISHSYATRYLRVAHYKEELPGHYFTPWVSENGKVIQPTFAHALRYLEGLHLPRLGKGGNRKAIPDTVREEIVILRERGGSYANIAELTGVSQTTAYHVCNPEKYGESIEKKKVRAARQRAALDEVSKQRERAKKHREYQSHRPVRLTEDGLAYIRRSLQKLQEAHDLSSASSEKANLRKAMATLHQAEDTLKEFLAQRAA